MADHYQITQMLLDSGHQTKRLVEDNKPREAPFFPTVPTAPSGGTPPPTAGGAGGRPTP